MIQRVKVEDLPVFDAAEYLDSPEAIAAYLTEVLSEGDSAALVQALGTVARARGMTDIAAASGVTREALYRALRPEAQPRFDTVARVLTALGLRLSVAPAPEAST